ncbi:alpha-2-macroglobulin family protein [Microbulbifer sp. OS29]|uniref:Alpha-2-macroglobulin family protein n=1 Tax=Microbulbifer okhotskensis TaxID=2926617 RepID=A0A9X2EM40_9GAMM|nr:alpha-2-macroglobulin [Microbulbifer okhotskensis]MCO1334772.1 alpha-2-macroglobulin family protein [Microbulbifer okhotskensis]
MSPHRLPCWIAVILFCLFAVACTPEKTGTNDSKLNAGEASTPGHSEIGDEREIVITPPLALTPKISDKRTEGEADAATSEVEIEDGTSQSEHIVKEEPPQVAITNSEGKSAIPKSPNSSLKVLHIGERMYKDARAIAVIFSEPLLGNAHFGSYLTLTREDGDNVDGGWVLSDNQKALYFPNVEPNTRYQLSIQPGLPSEDGFEVQTLKQEWIRTRRIEPSISFSSNGSIFPATVSPGLPVTAVSIEAVQIHFHRVKPGHYADFFGLIKNQSLKHYYRLQALNGVADFVYSAHFDLTKEKYVQGDFDLSIGHIEPLQQPGIYVAVMQPAGMYNTSLYDVTHFSISNLGLHARHYQDRVDLYVSSLDEGEALKDIQVELLNSKGELIKQHTTSKDGHVRFELSPQQEDSQRFFVAWDVDTRHFSLLDLREPALDLSDFKMGQRPSRPIEFFMYGPRDLYRPTESIQVSGLLRNYDGRYLKDLPIKAELVKPDNTSARTFTWHSSAPGYYEKLIPLPQNAPTGDWRLDVELADGRKVNYPFKVEEFLPERMKLIMQDGEERSLVQGHSEALSLEVEGSYLYGAPAVSNRLETLVQVSHYREPFPQWKGFLFGDSKEPLPTRQFNAPTIVLDEEGLGKLPLPSRWKRAQSPLKINLLSSLFESGGRPVTRQHPVLVWPKHPVVGIRPNFGEENPTANSKPEFEIIVTNAQGELVNGRNLKAVLISEDRQYFWEYSASQGWHYEYSSAEYEAFNRQLEFTEEHPLKLTVPVEYGHYRLEVTDTNTGTTSSLHFHAGRDWYYWWRKDQVTKGQAARPDTVALSLDKPSYTAGDLAELTIVPPSDGEALVLVESDQLLWSERVSVKKSGTNVEIPISPEWDSHDTYISVTALRPADKRERIAPNRAFGLTHLPLDREPRRLPVTLEAPARALPGSEIEVTVNADIDSIGNNGGTAWTTLAAVDIGVLNITRFETPDPFEAFFGQRRYGVDVRDIYHRIIESGSGKLVEQRFGGDAELARGGDEPNSDVQIVSLFSGPVAFDAQGKAQVSLRLPEFNGSLRLMAVSFSQDGFGSTDTEMTVASPVVTQAALPRFMAPGDNSTLALDLNNLSGRTQQLTVEMQSVGAVDIEMSERLLELADGERKTLRFPITAKNATGDAEFQLVVHGAVDEAGQDIAIERQWRLGVRPAWPATTRTQRRLLAQGESLQPESTFLDSLMPDTVQTLVSLDSRPQLQLQDHLANLLSYPYGCLEQTSSRVYPLVMATPLRQQKLGIEPLDESERARRIDAGIERIFSMQKGNGSFGLWSSESPENQWLTVYVADLLLRARDQGIVFDNTRLESTLKRLQDYARERGSFYQQRYSSAPDFYAYAARSYAAYVLSRVQKISLGQLRSLYENGTDLTQSPLPKLHLAIALHTMGDSILAQDALQKAIAIERKRRSYYGDYGSDLRDTALMIALLLENNIAPDKAEGLLFEMADLLRERQYLSTQERNSVFMAGVQLQLNSGENWSATLNTLDGLRELNSDTPYNNLFRGRDAADAIEVTGQIEKLYAAITTNGYSKSAPAIAMDKGVKIQRSYHKLDGSSVVPAEVREGELYLVRLEISSDQRLPDLLAIDLLPAGFELENQNLADSIKVDELKFDGKTIAQWQDDQDNIQHTEFRDDRFVAALDQSKWKPTNLFYIARAVTPGRYQVPPPYVEDMYNPERFAIGKNPLKQMQVIGKQ